MNGRTVLDSLNAWQVEAYRRCGRDPSTVRSEGIAASKRFCEQLGVEWDPSYDYSVTTCQDPIILLSLTKGWKEIHTAANELWPSLCPPIEKVLLATLPLSILNGFAFRDNSLTFGIVLWDGLRFVPTHIARAIVQILVSAFDDRVEIDLSRDNWRERVALNPSPIDSLFGVYVMHHTHEGIPYPEDYNKIPSGNLQLKNLELRIAAGFHYFVLAHELSHCIFDHPGQKRNEIPLQTRSKSYMDQLSNKVHESQYRSHVTSEMMFNVCAWQFHETISDASAIAILIRLMQKQQFPPYVQFLRSCLKNLSSCVLAC